MFFGDQLMGEKVKKKLKSCGSEVKIFPLAKIANPKMVEIGNNSMIDDYTFINGGLGVKIGKYVHMAIFSCIIGGGEIVIEDYCVIGYGTIIITGTDNYRGGKRMSTALPEEQRNIERGSIVIEQDAFIGAKVVIHPNVTIGEGAIIGSNSLVLKDLEPWTIYAGNPCKIIGKRPRINENDIL